MHSLRFIGIFYELKSYVVDCDGVCLVIRLQVCKAHLAVILLQGLFFSSEMNVQF